MDVTIAWFVISRILKINQIFTDQVVAEQLIIHPSEASDVVFSLTGMQGLKETATTATF